MAGRSLALLGLWGLGGVGGLSLEPPGEGGGGTREASGMEKPPAVHGGSGHVGTLANAVGRRKSRDWVEEGRGGRFVDPRTVRP